MKDYYFKPTKQEVSLGDIIPINGFNTQITMDVINANPDNFEEVDKKYELLTATRYYKKDSTAFADIFTKGKIYQLIPGKFFEDFEAFFDNNGRPNGLSGTNHRHFISSTKEAYDLQCKIEEVTKEEYELQYEEVISIRDIPESIVEDVLETCKIEIKVQPAKSAGFINVDFVVTATGADFTNSTKEKFDAQELLKETIERYPIGTLCKVLNNPHGTFKIMKDDKIEESQVKQYYLHILAFPKKPFVEGLKLGNSLRRGNKWAPRYVFTTKDDVNIFEGDTYWLVSIGRKFKGIADMNCGKNPNYTYHSSVISANEQVNNIKSNQQRKYWYIPI